MRHLILRYLKTSLWSLPLLMSCSGAGQKAASELFICGSGQSVEGLQQTSFPELTIAPLRQDLQGIQQAIDICSSLGGGHVEVAAGLYLCDGPIVLRSNVDLHLDSAATILFSGEPKDFLPVVETRFEGVDLLNYSPMIYANGAENVAITGQGTIDAQGSRVFAAWGKVAGDEGFEENIHGTHGETVEMEDVNLLRQLGSELAPLKKRVFGEGHYLRPTCVEFRECSRVLIEGITLKDSPFWCIHPLYSSDVIVRGVTIDSHNPNNDGCDPESSTRVLIEDCNFMCGDDAVAIKSGRDADGRQVGRPSSNIVIRRCLFNSECNGLCIGSEMSGGVENVVMDSVEIASVKNALLFKSNKDRGGYIRNVAVSNIQIQHVEGAVLRFENNYFGYRGGNCPSQYENFAIENVHAKESNGYAIYFDGLEELPMQNIAVSNFHVDRAARPYYIYNVKNYVFDNCSVNGESIPAIPAPDTERQSCDVW